MPPPGVSRNQSTNASASALNPSAASQSHINNTGPSFKTTPKSQLKVVVQELPDGSVNDTSIYSYSFPELIDSHNDPIQVKISFAKKESKQLINVINGKRIKLQVFRSGLTNKSAGDHEITIKYKDKHMFTFNTFKMKVSIDYKEYAKPVINGTTDANSTKTTKEEKSKKEKEDEKKKQKDADEHNDGFESSSGSKLLIPIPAPSFVPPPPEAL